jgi:hypothetical protein
MGFLTGVTLITGFLDIRIVDTTFPLIDGERL